MLVLLPIKKQFESVWDTLRHIVVVVVVIWRKTKLLPVISSFYCNGQSRNGQV